MAKANAQIESHICSLWLCVLDAPCGGLDNTDDQHPRHPHGKARINMAVNKIKRGKAVSALIASGMAPSTAARYVRMLDLDQPLAPQIAELAEDMADLFGA